MLDRLAAKRTLDLVLAGVLTILIAPLLRTLSRLLMLDLLILFKTVRVVIARTGSWRVDCKSVPRSAIRFERIFMIR